MKIIMPIAGKGTRLRPHTHTTPKSLIRVAGKPIICYIMEQIQTIDFSEIIFIVGHLEEQIMSFMKSEYKHRMKFVRQDEYHGLGHAIDQAKGEFKKDDSVLILLGDIIFTADIAKVVGSETNKIGVMEVEDPRRFGVVTVDKKNIVTHMIEKPENPATNLAIAGIYYFKSAHKLFDAIHHIIMEKIKTRNEYQLTDAMKEMMAKGEKFETFRVPEWYDCGEKESLLDTNKVMLSRYATHNDVKGSIIIPPVFIGKNVKIKNAIIGPNVSISADSIVKNSIVKNTILGTDTVVENTVLNSSLIGDHCALSEAPREFNIGPDSEIIFTK
jgi:glucose-1-phosphate thymidylyltransferase